MFLNKARNLLMLWRKTAGTGLSVKTTAMFITFFLFLPVSCSPGKAPSTQSITPAPLSKIPASDQMPPIKPSPEQEWEKVLNLARREGTIVVHSSGTVTGARDIIIRSFKDKYGIDVQFISGGASDLTERTMRERRTGIYSVDVHVSGSTTFINLLKPAGALDLLEPVLVLPDVIDGNKWFGGKLEYLDQEHRVLAFGISMGPQFMVNTDLVVAGEVKNYRDFMNPKWKGKIVLPDPTVPGTGQKAMAFIGSTILGWDAIREMAAQEPIITRDARLQTEWVAKAKYPLAFAVQLGLFAEFKNSGAPIQLGVAPDASYGTAAGAVIALIDKAPHPNASKLFINWLLSREGQTTIYKQMNIASRRPDVPTEGINPVTLPDTKAKFYNSDAEEWLLKQPEYTNEVRKIFGPLLTR